MASDDRLLRTKLYPPRQQRRVLARPALLHRLGDVGEYRLTLVQAGTGYGKTTALATLGEGGATLFWYTVGEGDADPRQFLAYLISTFLVRLPGLPDAPLAALQEHGAGSPELWQRSLDALINALSETLDGPAVLVIDDYHLAAESPEIEALVRRFVSYLPPDLHAVIASRQMLHWPELIRWRARGEVQEITREMLAFQLDEIAALFRDSYGVPLAPAEVAALARTTEGWPIALQLVWQGLRSGASRTVAELLAAGPSSVAALFEYLADDVLGHQPPELAAFLRGTAVLRELTPEACAAVLAGEATPDASAHAAALLDRLQELGLFVVALGERHYRYHHLFHDFLRQQPASPAEQSQRHRRAARFFQTSGETEEAIYHWLAAGDYPAAADAIEQVGDALVHSGRLDTLALWVDALPAEVLDSQPRLQAYLGDVSRLRSRFDEALAWYAQAEQAWRTLGDRAGVSRALRGQALVYLDTVRPAQAESLLEEALRLNDNMSGRASRARLLDLLAENKLNMGKPGEAETLREEARALREEGPGEDVLSVRVKLRTGQIEAALQVLEGWAAAERHEAECGQPHQPRSHRETVLIMSLIHAMSGRPSAARTLAEEAIALGERLKSPFITAVGHIRLGHACQLQPAGFSTADRQRAHEQAVAHYRSAVEIGDRLAVRRIRAEAMMGLTRAYGFVGNLAEARAAASEGVEIARWAGDHWMIALTELMLGASFALAGQYEEAIEVLSRVLITFRDCGDKLGRAATRLWLALAHRQLGQPERFAHSLDDLLELCDTHGYHFLFTAPSLLAPPDQHALIPLLLEARQRHPSALPARLLAAQGMADLQFHPGYQLRVQLLGAFRVWRGETELEPRDWQRDKARQLFQLLLTQRGRWLQRDELTDQLWPDQPPDSALRDFKVALSVLNKVLEPKRPGDAPFSFIAREGTAYRLRPGADVWIDTAQFEQECEAGVASLERGTTEQGIGLLHAALARYHGTYLPEALYEDWSTEERERLLALFMRSTERLAGALLASRRYDEAAAAAQEMLAYDSCWEPAYRVQMQAFLATGNRSQALRVYQRCCETLERELGVAPSPATEELGERLN